MYLDIMPQQEGRLRAISKHIYLNRDVQYIVIIISIT